MHTENSSFFQKKGLVCRHLYTKGNKVVAANKCKSQVNKYHKAGTTGRVQDGIMLHVTQNIICEHIYFFFKFTCTGWKQNVSQIYLFVFISELICFPLWSTSPDVKLQGQPSSFSSPPKAMTWIIWCHTTDISK